MDGMIFCDDCVTAGSGKTSLNPEYILQSDIDDLIDRVTKLERRVAKLEKALKPAKALTTVGVYYRNGKPLKRKPRKEVEK